VRRLARMPESLPVEPGQTFEVSSLESGRSHRLPSRHFLLVVAAALVALSLTGSLAAATATVTSRRVSRPSIVWKPIPFGSKRRAEMAAYAKRHYGIDTWRLQGPHVIVEHYTASNSFTAAWNAFAANTPDPELHELPGDCAHFIIDRDGTIYQLVRLNTMCRHTVGLNYTAIGIEHVGTSDSRSCTTANSWLPRSASPSGSPNDSGSSWRTSSATTNRSAAPITASATPPGAARRTKIGNGPT
jgi:N-acetylmuramoyl-L-alanine amidase